MKIAPGTRLGPYEVVEPLAAGGMGEVYRGRDTRLDRDVAIKVLPSHLSANPHVRERFHREARAISRLTHPHICTLYDVGRHDGIDYLVMEYLVGETVAEAVARGPLPLAQVLRHGREIAEALDKAHREGIVHRDLKPGNIMLTRSGAKVLDFGLAKYVTAEPSTLDGPTQQKPLTEEGTIVGTLQYMAPEQLEAREADARTDIFALGAILYEMSTGRRAFEATSRASLIAAIMEHDPAPMATIQPMTPLALDQVVRRCLAKAPDDRLQSARDLQFALEQIDEQSRSGPAPLIVARSRRAPLYIALAALVLVVAGIAGWRMFHGGAPAGGLATVKTFAVLPFANLGVDRAHDYLRLAIPDEITTILSSNQALVVRPFSVSRRMSGEVDPQKAAQELNASGIISGHLRGEGGRLSVTLEVIDVRDNKLFWRDVFEAPADDLLTMRRELSTRIRTGLMPRLASGGESPERSGPKNADAYALYLRAAALSTDAAPNAEALRMLEEAARMDASYAPAWSALARRAYLDYSYGSGGQPAFARAQEAVKRALQLDPDLVDASRLLIVMHAEAGESIEAWRDARQLVNRRPDSADARFALAYVLRYGGALRESANECNTAWSIDNGNKGLRSCALTFLQLGDHNRALDFVRLEGGTAWGNRVTANIYLQQGRAKEAIPLFNADARALIAAAVANSPAEIDRAIAKLRENQRARADGEPFYFIASFASFARRPSAALELLREAVRRNYCTYPAIDSEPLFESLRSLPEYRQFRESAIACHEKFLRETNLMGVKAN